MSASGSVKRRRGDEPSSRSEDVDRSGDAHDSEGSGEDLLGDNMHNDYQDMGALDRYDSGVLDDRDYGGADFEARRAAESALQERDRREGRGRSRIAAVMESDDEEEESEEGFRARQRRRRHLEQTASAGEDAAAEEAAEPFDLETFKVPLREWLEQEQTQKEVKRRFRNFLETYTTRDTVRVFEKVIDDMTSNNRQSLPVSYLYLTHHSPVLAMWIADAPKKMLSLMDEVATAVVAFRLPDYHLIHPDIHVRITQLPIHDNLRELRHTHLNMLINVVGVVTRRTAVFPQLKVVNYICSKCSSLVGPFNQTDQSEIQIGSCPDCQSKGPFTVSSTNTVYRNFQKMTLQESPGSVPPGRVPRHKEVILLADLIDAARPGEEVEVTGVYINSYDASLNSRQGFPVFHTMIEANHVMRKNDATAASTITAEEMAKLVELSNKEDIVRRICHSIGPSIYGCEHAKLAVAMAMFGGREKNKDNKHRIRGDINVLLLGDPGTAKSQLLKYIEKSAPRCVYTTGKGASAVGLTAAVHKDPMTGEWVLEGGALVLADRGVCLIDEFDKMNDQDRTSIHEAMEQQSISISKAGIVTTLQARCSVIAAANPIGGRYDVSKTFSENVLLTDPILQRFDVLCVLRDEADPVLDERLATFVVESHAKSHPDARKEARDAAGIAGVAEDSAVVEERATEAMRVSMFDGAEVEAIPQSLLKKYIMHAKTLKPSLTRLDMDKVARLYADMRKESEISNGVPIAVRHIESIIRMSEASARMRLSSVVSDTDLNLAIKVMLDSFISAQKFAVMRTLRRQFARYLTVTTDYNAVLLVKLRELVRERITVDHSRSVIQPLFDQLERVEIPLQQLKERVSRHHLSNEAINTFLTSDMLKAAAFKYDDARKVLVRQGDSD